MNRGEEIGLFFICFGIAIFLVDSLRIFHTDSMILYGVIAIIGGILIAYISNKIGKAWAGNS
jgi:hypothetical protein